MKWMSLSESGRERDTKGHRDSQNWGLECLTHFIRFKRISGIKRAIRAIGRWLCSWLESNGQRWGINHWPYFNWVRWIYRLLLYESNAKVSMKIANGIRIIWLRTGSSEELFNTLLWHSWSDRERVCVSFSALKAMRATTANDYQYHLAQHWTGIDLEYDSCFELWTWLPK